MDSLQEAARECRSTNKRTYIRSAAAAAALGKLKVLVQCVCVCVCVQIKSCSSKVHLAIHHGKRSVYLALNCKWEESFSLGPICGKFWNIIKLLL